MVTAGEVNVAQLRARQMARAAIVGAAIGTAIAPVLGTAVGALVGAIVAAVVTIGGVVVQYIIDNYVKDETSAGWGWLQNWSSSSVSTGSNIKLGQIMWFNFGSTLGIPFAYPLWYGGMDVGVGGW